jgi:biopolymer transport protein ExbD
MNMALAQTSVLELNFPSQTNNQENQDVALQLQVIILKEKLVVSDNKGGVIKSIESKEGVYNFEMLGKVIQDLKSRIPDKKDITVMAEKKTSYQTLVSVMDKVRSYKAVVAGSLVHAELFPEISIADAPEVVSAENMADVQAGSVGKAKS